MRRRRLPTRELRARTARERRALHSSRCASDARLRRAPRLGRCRWAPPPTGRVHPRRPRSDELPPRSQEPRVAELSIGTIDVYVVRPVPGAWRVLVLQRALDTRCPTAWETVHGRLELGEEPEEGAL